MPTKLATIVLTHQVLNDRSATHLILVDKCLAIVASYGGVLAASGDDIGPTTQMFYERLSMIETTSSLWSPNRRA